MGVTGSVMASPGIKGLVSSGGKAATAGFGGVS
jgi:hypothetical protein